MTTERILVLCTGNSARSQMAEAWLARLPGGRFEVASAGSVPSVVHPLAVEVMAERGIDIADRRSKHLDEYREQSFDWVITVCDRAAADCPAFPGPAERLHWSFPDPAAATGDREARLEIFRAVRDAIERRVSDWLRQRSDQAG